MTRFGDFTLHEELAESEVADCFAATHDVQGGPLFLKRYRRVDPAYAPALLYRCEVLMAVQHPNLAPHLGHGDVDGVVFAVSPFLAGIDLDGFIASVKQRRVVVKLEALLYIVREVARGVAALHAAAHDGQRALLAHGDVCTRHVRLGPSGEVWLTGLPTPRGLAPDRPPEIIWDAAGLGALLYDLIPLTRTGGQRPPLPGPLDRVVRRTLGIGPAADQMAPAAFAERLDEVADLLKLPRLEPRLLEDAAARALQHQKGQRGMSAADALPTLEPVLPVEAPRPSSSRATDPFRETAPTERPPPLLADINQVPTEPPDRPPLDFSSLPDEAPVMPPPVRPVPPPRPAPSPPAQRAAELDAFARRPTAPSQRRAPEPRLPPAAAASADELGELGELSSLDSIAPVGSASAPWVAAPDEPSRPAATNPFDLVDDLPLDPDDDLPLDPFVEQTLPGHLLGLGALPSDEPSAFDVNPTPLSTTKPRTSEAFEEDRTRPELTALAAASAETEAELADKPSPSTTDPDGALPKALEIPREISAIVKLDAPLREKLGLLADPPEAAPSSTSSTSDDDEGAFADSSGAFEEDPAVAALVSRGVVTPADVKTAREAQKSRGGKVPEILVATGVITDTAVADALAAEAVKPRMSDEALSSHLPEPELCRRLPQTYALARRMLPLLLDGGQLTLAVADPFDEAGIREVTRLVGASGARVHVVARGALTDATLEAYRALGARLTTGEGTPSVLLCMHDEDETARFGARLADEGFHVAHAADVPTAKMLLDAHPPAALILALDVADAESLLVFSRGHDEHADTPVFVTGEAGDDAAMAHILDLGADDFFERPASLNVVMAKLRRALNKRGPTTPSAQTPRPPPLPASITTPPKPAEEPAEKPPAAARAVPPPTYDFWENSAPLDEMAPYEDEEPPADAPGGAPMYAEPTGVMGTLRQMAVTEIVQSLELGRKTARVELVPTDGQRGMVGFEDGRITYAECGTLRGEQAFYALARHTEGFFRIRYGEGPAARNVDNTTTYLLLEAMRLMDEETGPGDAGELEGIGAEKTPTPFD